MDGLSEYRMKIIETMLKAERNQPEEKKYGAHLSHWSDSRLQINLDEGALEVLIEYYKNKKGE